MVVCWFSVTFAWQFFNASSLFAVSNNEWFVMCKRLHKRRLVQDDLHNRCMKLYRASQCYMPFKFIDYCCAVDENGELWFGCPNEIRIKEDKDGSQCAWNCGDDGMFVQEYPICRRNTACTASFHGIQYSAPIGRHAISRCPKGFSGYSSWYCMSNKTFQGIPNYTCCNTTQLCKTVDPYLNIWISCPSNKATKKVMCPSDALLTEATVEWHCTSQFVFNGTSPNYSNCNRTDVVCLETDRYKREWKAAGGTVAQKPCPDSVKEMCYWKCNEIGRFETPEPDCSKCSVDSLDEIFEKVRKKIERSAVPPKPFPPSFF